MESEIDGNYCPSCGRSFKVNVHAPTRRELEQFARDVKALLPRLRAVRLSLERSLSAPAELDLRATSQLSTRRHLHLVRIEERLVHHLRWAQAELRRLG
jgi:hypothetical protein